MYVQDLIKDKFKTEMANLLTQTSAKIFICGESKIMIPQIELALAKCLESELNITESEAQEKIRDLKTMQRIVVEQWFWSFVQTFIANIQNG